MQSLECLRPSAPMDCTATVLDSRYVTPTIKSIWLQLSNPIFSFLPGQSVWPRFERDGRKFSKIYSIASSPKRSPEVELCVSRVGWSSAYIQDLVVGETISVRGPYGLMTLNQLPKRPRLYVAEGSGIAPLKSQIDWLRDSGYSQPIWLVLANPETVNCLPYHDYWRSLQQTWRPFHYVEAIHRSPEAVLVAQDLDLSQFEIDICGVGDRVTQICESILAMGANPGQMRSEKFVAF
ncbi:MAG: FAD-dependent oxidoreductase [Leptolyngbyaceae cyanobacterium SM1_4_3]|nr:FAD-dependent oxidoreductase [Leptolyngbyaceae cyanobacterium SM1_4_3]NJN92003.1 FAD-dependent oxidoreductase [Leptolyngbyaceae cyanobacterium SL_5_14]